jgi:hypothetical protein
LKKKEENKICIKKSCIFVAETKNILISDKMEDIINEPVENIENKEEPTNESVRITDNKEGQINEPVGNIENNPLGENSSEENEITISDADMTKIIIFIPLLPRYLKADHPAYHRLILADCENYISTTITPALISTYKAKIDQEEVVLRWGRKSEYTEKKKEIDAQRDEMYKSMLAIVHANLANHDISLQDNARHVNTMLESFGDITKIDYKGETNMIKQIIIKLKSPEYVYAAQTLGLLTWAEDLEIVNTLFEAYENEADRELKTKPKISFKEARKETDDALKVILDRVKGIISLGLDANVVNFVEDFNRHTNQYNNLVREHYGRTHQKTDISDAEIETIPDQDYTGEEINYIPKVSVQKTDLKGNVTTVKLKFSVDFYVTYKDNIGPGTATILMQGIGKYTGKREAIFNIKHKE